MWRQWLTLLIITLSFYQFVKATQYGVCQNTKVEKEPCTNGTRNIRITTYVKDNGICTPFKTKTQVNCESKRKDFCKCSAVGDPHYRTYDGQVIHFYGDCRYTLTQHNREDDPCSFNIEVQNEYRGDNKYFTYTKSVIIHMFKEVYELGQKGVLKVNGQLSHVPYEKSDDVRIFKSHQFLQFVAPRCSVRVAFDGDSNAFVEVSKRYSKKMNGICGDCNGVRDDFKTRGGRDVSNKRNKYSLIGNSYSVSKPGHHCKKAKDISYKSICGKDWIRSLKAKKHCGVLLEPKNPFSKCARKGHIDIKNFYQDCVIDMCVNKNRPSRWQKVRCEIFSGLAEVCSEAGFEGIKWRSQFNCPLQCGKNAHFSEKANPCPRTCENHFFGTKRPCYDLPEREGCTCNRGYIRDGALCVKPMHCKCINLCVDRESSEKCRKWKRQGQCKELSEAMNIICPKTCGFCKAKAGHCEDELSARKCLEFRNKGLCYHDFYKAICGLTCNYDKCNCGKDRVFVGKCDMSTNRITTTHYKFARDSQGRCAKIITQSHKACNCNKVTKVRKRCNLCTGTRKIILHIKEIVANKCVQRKRVIVEKCNKCHKRIRKERRCIGNRSIKTTITFYKLKGCYLCVLERKSRTTVIKCKSTKTVKRDRRTCIEHTKIIRRRPVNCRCREDVIYRKRKWCCNRGIRHLPPKCQNGRIVYRTIYYKFNGNGCVPHFKDVIKIPKCKSERKSIKGACVRKRRGKFFCKAIDFKLIRRLNSKCKCITRKLACMRTCCCRKSKQCTTCNRRMGIVTVVTTKYRLVKKRHRYVCVRYEKRISKTIRYKTQFIVIKGKCGANCLRKDKIIRKFRYGCKIVKRFFRHDVRICCCRPKQRKFVCCIGNNIIIKIYKKILKANRCVKILKTCLKKRIRCPPTVVKQSRCVYRKRRRKITTISYFLKKCRCFKRTRICYKRCTKCQYKELGTKIGKCDKTTCFRRTYIFFQNENCQKGTKICDYRCCCLFRKIKRSYCNKCNGIRYDILKWWDFNEKLRICIPRSKRIAFVPKCKKGLKVKGKCGVERKNYIKIITTSERYFKSKCQCRKFRLITWKVCKCPLRRVVKKTCIGTFYYIKEYEYRLDKIRNKCLRRTIRRRDGIMCAMLVKTKRKNITKCIYNLYTGILKPINCRCKWVWTAEKVHKCCDDKSSETTKCKNKRFIVTRSITYHLISRKRPCIRRVKRSSIAITCKKYIRIRRTRCKSGIYWIITKFYQVNNCKCGRVRTTRRKVICECIPSETVKRICIGAGHQKIVTKFTLINEKCVAHSKITFYPKKCPPSYDVRGKCDRKTGLITVRRIYHISKNCKCVREKLTLTVRCPCFRKDRIVRRRCDKKGRRTIEIQRRVSSKRKCIWKVIKSYWEDCRCPRPRSITRCVEHGIYRTKTTFYQLKITFTDSIPLRKCIKFEREKDRKIICNRGYVTKTCVRHRKIEVRCIFEKRNCRCVKYCKTIITGPCQCKKLNKCREKCIKNIRYNVCYRFKAGRKHCLKSRHDYPIREKCPRRKIECKSCSLRKNNGIYRSCRITYFVYHNCRCVEKNRYRLRLCKCGGDITSRPRCINNRKVIETTSFYRVKNHCVGRKRQHFILIDCFRPRLRISELKCSTKYKLEYFLLRNCKCVKITIIRKNSKCCKRPIVHKKCDKHLWVYTLKSFHQRPTNVKLFPEINSPIKATFCEISKKRWVKHVICPRKYKTKICYTKQNKLVIKHYFYVVINCKCKLQVSKKVTKCVKCPRTKIIRSDCGPRGKKGRRYLNVTIKRYRITRENKCKLVISRRIEVCECEKTKKMTLCKSGQRIFITIWYNINTKPVCRPTLIKKAISISCYNKGLKNRWVLVRTVRCRYPGEYTIKYFERDVYNSKTCSCKRKRKSRKVSICCKPRKFIKRCRNNIIEHIRISEVPRALKCNIVTSTKRFPIICRKPRTEVVGNCHGKVIRYRTVSYRILKCRCVRRVRYHTITKRKDSIKCVRHMSWRRSHIPYKLINGLCVAQPARITYRYIGCPKFVRFVDKRIDECTFKRTFIGKYPKHCKCTDFVKKTIVLNYRCCQKGVVLKTCEHNNTKVTTRISYRLLDFKCFPVKKVTKRKLRCRLKRRERISTGLCTYVIRKYSVFIRKCKCYRKLLKIIKKEKCCKKPKTSYHCDAKTGKKIFITISYQHTKDDVCIKLKRVVSSLINCHRIKCTKTETRCVKNTRTVYMYCHLRKACKCIRTKVKEFRHCCGSLFKWIKTGDCGQHKKYYIRRRYYRLQMDKAGKRCRAVLVKEQFVRCKCPKSFTKMKCVSNRYNKVIRYYYRLEKGTCILKRSQKLVLISSCPEKTKIKVRDHCSKKTGWRYVMYRIIYPKRCKCVEKKHSFKEICICSVAFPSSKERVYCKKDNTIVRDKRVAICTRRRVKWTLITISIKIIHCKKVKIEIGLCYRDRNAFAISIRYDTKVQYFTKNCRCQRKVINRILKHCACRANHRSKQCIANSIVIKHYSYSVVRGRCRQRVRKFVRKVHCPSKPRITKSKCKRNKYIVTKRTYSRKNCRCLVSIRRKTCDCKCPKNRKYRKCSRNYAILEVSIVYHKKNCRCVRRKSIQQFVPSCPRFIVKTKGPCVPGKIDFYQEITRRKLVKDFRNCKCLVREIKRKRICACRKTIQKRRRCVSNHNVFEIFGWKVNKRRNKCERYLVSSNSIPKRCGKSTIKIICNLKTGVEKKIITKIRIRHCKCLTKVRVIRKRCKCKKGLVLVEQGKCAKRPVCVRLDKYQYEVLVKGKCEKRFKTVKVICCCAKKQKYKKCEGNNMVTVIISFTLKLGKCVRRELRTSAHLKCSSKVTVKESKCGKNGFKIRRYFKDKLRNCKCVKKLVDEDRCQCRCRRNFKRKICNNRKRYIKKVTVEFHLKKCKCIRKKSTEILSIKCPSKHSSVSMCIRKRKTNYWLITTRTTKYYVNKRCVCVPKVFKKSKICRCKRNRKTNVTCSAKRHELIYVTRFTVLKNGQCVRVAKTRVQKIRCNGKWKLKSESGCQPRGFYGVKTLTYSKLVHDKCRCKEVSKTRRCHCACSGIPSSTVCIKERIHRKIYKYKIIKCKCRQLIRSENVSFVKCRKIRPKIGKCKTVRNRCVRVVVHRIPYTINCRCHYRPKLVFVPCKTCRCPQYTTKKCQALSNRIVIKRYICHILANGLIQKSVEVKMNEIHCLSIMTCRQVTRCHKKSMTQKFLCRVPHKENCKCRSKEVKRTYPCKCKPDEMKIGKCNRKTCLKTLTRKIFHLVVLTNNKVKCQEEKRFYKQKCCCPPNPKDVVKCFHNRLTRKTLRFVFDKSQKTCSIIRRSFDETPSCQPPVRKIKGKCDKKRCLKRITYIERKLVNCQCRKRRSVKIRNCCCLKKDYIKVKCIKNVSVVSKHRFVWRNRKCHEFVNRISHIIKCRRSHVHRGKCNLRTGFRILRIHKYRKEKCRCIRSVKVKELRCICKPNRVNQICLKDKGIIRKIFITYRLNERRNKCDKFIRNEDRQISCNKNERVKCSPIRRRENNGAYRKCTTTWEERVGCKCEEQIHWIFSLLHCKKPTTTKRCIKNNIVTTITYYVKERSLVKNYDYQCVEKRKVIVSPKKLCSRPYITKTDCIDSFQTYTLHYYTRIMCQCVPKTKVYRVRCLCEGPKVVKTQCIDDIRIRTTIRSYKLQCDRKRIPTCQCISIDTKFDKDVKCPDDKFNERCEREAMIRTWTTYDIQNCKCVADSQTDTRPDCKESICKDVLTNNKCHKIKKFGKCNQMNIYYQFLCPLTCGYCEKCEKPAIKKYLNECSCKRIAGKRICSRSVLVIEFIPDGKKCRKVKRTVESLCDCSNILPNSLCEKFMRNGRCSNVRYRAQCAYHCNPKCQHCERNRVYKICLQNGPHKGKYEILRIKYFKIEGACFFTRKVSYEGSCELCSTRRTKIVTSCFEGKRFVITKYVVKRRDGTCKNKERRVAYSCADCCNEIITKIGVCGSRSRVVIITFWANIKGCCRKQKVVNKYACNKRCARIESVQSKCMYNKQLVIKTWYSDRMCLPHTVYELADCHP